MSVKDVEVRLLSLAFVGPETRVGVFGNTSRLVIGCVGGTQGRCHPGDRAVKILRLDIKGFRSLKEVSWEPGGLNVVIGPNGSGKSNLLRMLELISVSARGGLGKYVQHWGGMEPLVWDGRADEIAFTLQSLLFGAGQAAQRETLAYEFVMERLGRGTSFRVARELLTAHRDQPDGSVKLVERESGLYGGVLNLNHEWAEITDATLADSEQDALFSTWGMFPVSDPRVRQFRSDLAGWSVYHDVHMDANAPARQAVVTRAESVWSRTVRT